MIGRVILLAALPAWAACRAPDALGRDGTIDLVLVGEPGSHGVEARGLPDVREPEGGWSVLFRVSVASAHRAGGPAVLGRYQLDEGLLLFEPRYALQPGLEYTAVLRLVLLPGATGNEPDLVRSLVVPCPEEPVEPVVTAVYPSARPLPANVLKFYVHFSRPMARGYAYDYTRVLDDAGRRVERPFLELSEELWNPDGTRLTLLVDPGRIKRGLLLHEELGPVLEEGRQYTLLVEAGWPGADRTRLAEEVRIEFETVAADALQPNPEDWDLEPPPVSTRRPLVVALDEPLDHALLQHMLRVVGADGQSVEGSVQVGAGEERWSFVPRDPWEPGEHALLVDVGLEDLAGNSVGRRFETRLGAASPVSASAPVRVPFRPLP